MYCATSSTTQTDDYVLLVQYTNAQIFTVDRMDECFYEGIRLSEKHGAPVHIITVGELYATRISPAGQIKSIQLSAITDFIFDVLIGDLGERVMICSNLDDASTRARRLAGDLDSPMCFQIGATPYHKVTVQFEPDA